MTFEQSLDTRSLDKAETVPGQDDVSTESVVAHYQERATEDQSRFSEESIDMRAGIEKGGEPLSPETESGLASLDQEALAARSTLESDLRAAGEPDAANSVEAVEPRMEDTPDYKQFLEEESLTFLRTKDAKYFDREYNGEVTADGYLMDKGGQETNFLASQNIGGGLALQEVQQRARARFLESRNPAESGKTTQEDAQDQILPEKPPPVPSRTFERAPPESRSGQLAETFKESGVEAEAIRVPGAGQFSEVVLMDRKNDSTEPYVRVYRGVNSIDDSLLTQTSYAMRESKYGSVGTNESVRAEVEALANEPSYANLMAYADKLGPNLKPAEQQQLYESVKKMEDGILEGKDIRTELMYQHIGHLGGMVADTDISPYISASYDPAEAAQYGLRGVMVIDIPISELEDFAADADGEVNIKSAVDKKYITAVLLREQRAEGNWDSVKADAAAALEAVDSHVPVPHYDKQQLEMLRKERVTARAAADKQQWEQDVRLVRERRAEQLTKRFSKVDFSEIAPSETEDRYAQIQHTIYDHYADRLRILNRAVADLDYVDSTPGRKPFSREQVNDKMLIQLRKLTEDLEDREYYRSTRT